jgi:hypothetical protein
MDLLPGAEPGFVKIIHPDTGGIAEVYRDGLAQYWLAGWRPLTEEDAPPADPYPGVPEPLTEAQVAEGRAAAEDKADKAAPAKSSKSTTKE